MLCQKLTAVSDSCTKTNTYKHTETRRNTKEGNKSANLKLKIERTQTRWLLLTRRWCTHQYFINKSINQSVWVCVETWDREHVSKWGLFLKGRCLTFRELVLKIFFFVCCWRTNTNTLVWLMWCYVIIINNYIWTLLCKKMKTKKVKNKTVVQMKRKKN